MNDELTTIARFQKGEADAFRSLYESESPRLARFVRRYVRSPDYAEDVFQETWLRVWSRRAQLRSPDRFTSWTYQIARNCIFEHLRRRDRKAEFTVFGDLQASDSAESMEHRIVDGSPNPRQQVMQAEWIGHVEAELQTLDPQAQEMLALRFGSELGLREIGDLMDVPLGSVCAKVSRSLKRLRKHLERRGLHWGD